MTRPRMRVKDIKFMIKKDGYDKTLFWLLSNRYFDLEASMVISDHEREIYDYNMKEYGE